MTMDVGLSMAYLNFFFDYGNSIKYNKHMQYSQRRFLES